MLYLIPVLLGITLMAFLLGIFSPGDPAQMALSQGIEEPTEEEIQAKRIELGLDKPYHVQYLSWLGRALHGDLGTSYLTQKPVSAELLQRMPHTLSLAFFSAFIAISLGIPLGLYMAVTKHRGMHNALDTMSVAFISIPGFCTALILIWIFAEKLRWLPTSGADGFRSFIMPAVALSIPTVGSIARLMKSSVQKELTRQYVLVAYSKGLRSRTVCFFHAFRNSLIPVVAFLGNFLGGILGGAAVIESIFSIPGLGSYALKAIGGRDYPALQGYVMITGFIFVMIHFLVDIVSFGLNPQIQLEGEKK